MKRVRVLRKKLYAYVMAIFILVFSIYTVPARIIDAGKKAYIVIIIDDFGYNGIGTDEMLELEIPFTAAVLPFCEGTVDICEKISEYNNYIDIIIHLPMEAKTGSRSWVGEKGIFSEMTDEQVRSIVRDAIEMVGCAIGVNNHMGSLIMEDNNKMNIIMDVISDNGLIFVNSKTTGDSTAKDVAKKYDISYYERVVFIDHSNDVSLVINQLKKAAEIALDEGYAVAIGHVGPAGGKTTIQGILDVREELEDMGIEFITLGELDEILNGDYNFMFK